MNYKKGLLAFCLIICILFTISGISASDIDDAAIASEDTNDNIGEVSLPAQEVAQETEDEISDDALAVESGENAIAVENDNEVIVSSADAADNKPLQSSESENGNVLSTDGDYATKITFYKQTGKYSNDKKIYVKLTDSKTGKLIDFDIGFIKVDIYNTQTGDSWFTHVEIKNGKGSFMWSDTGMGDGVFRIEASDYDTNVAKMKVTVYKNHVKITANKLKVPYKSKKKFKINVKGQDKKPVNDAILKVVIYSGKKKITKYLWTDSKGNAYYDKVSKLGRGTHKVIIRLDGNGYINNEGLYGKTVTSYIIIGKAAQGKNPVTIIAKKVSAKYKAKKYFYAKVVNSKTKKPVKGLAIVVKVGSKKAFALKTNANGYVAFSTSKLNVGTHKVILKVSNNKYYAGKAKTTSIRIVKAKTNSGSNSGSNSNTKKTKLSTKITINSCYKTGIQYYFKITLKDSKGRPLANRNIQVETLMYIGPMANAQSNTAKTNSRGVAEGYVTPMMGGIVTWEAGFKFAGDSSHKSSIASKYLG